jgi:HAD superfamily hydrolase (TIGR01509 family)
LFDVDGTLLDSNYVHAMSWRRALRECGYDVPTAWIHGRIGMDGDLMLRELLGPLDPAESDRLTSARQPHFEALVPDIQVLPGARELLAAVSQRGVRVVLATSAGAAELPHLLAALGPVDDVDVVTTGADVEAAKPRPDVFHAAMRQAGADPGRAIAVGDTVWDIAAATRAGLGCVCVETGGTGADALHRAGAVAVYRDVQELLTVLDVSPLAALWS